MKRILLAGATVIALTVAQPTLAADAPVYKGPAPVAAALFNWSGFYVGIEGGGIWSNTQWSAAGTTTPLANGSAGILGGTVGVNWQTGAWVFGIEGDYSWTGLRVTIPACGGAGGCTTDLHSLGTVRGRVGWATGATGSLLFYATAGFAFGQLEHNVPVGFVNTKPTATGWTVGGGLEVALMPNITAKAEYLYVDLGSTLVCSPIACPPGVNGDFVRSHVVRAGLNYKFW